jgi:hypothetical protein
MTHGSARLIRVIFFSIGFAVLATHAYAQGDLVDSAVAHVGVGAGINFYHPTDGGGDPSDGITIAYRWHSFHSGWGPTFGLDWHSTEFHQSLGSVDAPLGSLRMRAVLVGYGHTKRIKRFTASASVNGGYSFNDLTTDVGTVPAFASAGTSLIGLSVNNSFVAKPEVAVWYDVFKHVGVGLSAAYLITRPEEVMRTPAGTQSRNLRADTFELTVGLTFGVWKKPR